MNTDTVTKIRREAQPALIQLPESWMAMLNQPEAREAAEPQSAGSEQPSQP